MRRAAVIVCAALAAAGCGQGVGQQPAPDGSGAAAVSGCPADRADGARLIQGERSVAAEVAQWQAERMPGGPTRVSPEVQAAADLTIVRVCLYEGDFPVPGPERPEGPVVATILVFPDGSEVVDRVGPLAGYGATRVPSDLFRR